MIPDEHWKRYLTVELAGSYVNYYVIDCIRDIAHKVPHINSMIFNAGPEVVVSNIDTLIKAFKPDIVTILLDGTESTEDLEELGKLTKGRGWNIIT